VAQQDLGKLGPAQGPAVPAYCPLGDALRRVVLWFILLALLLLRKPNRTRQAWAIVPAWAAAALLLHAAEGYVNAHVTFYLHRHICTIICESLQALAGAIAVLLAMSDLLAVRRRIWRFLLVFLILFEAGALALGANAPVALSTGMWIAVFGFFLFVFLVGHAVLRGLLGLGVGALGRAGAGLRALRNKSGPVPAAGPPAGELPALDASLPAPAKRPDRLLTWSAALSLLLGAGPVAAFAVVGAILNRSLQLQSTMEYFRLAVTLSQALLGPYFVLFWFLLLARLVPLYRDRLARSFGYPA